MRMKWMTIWAFCIWCVVVTVLGGKAYEKIGLSFFTWAVITAVSTLLLVAAGIYDDFKIKKLDEQDIREERKLEAERFVGNIK